MLNKVLKGLLTGADKSKGKAAQTPAVERPSFLPRYDMDFAPHLAQRAPSFRIMIEKLEALARQRPGPLLIVETGSLRAVDDWGAGQSTLLWKAFSEFRDCEIHTVDLNPDVTALTERVCGDAVHAHTGDSVAFLHAMASVPVPRQIDLLYLDSFDFDPEEPFPSAMHHVKELIAIRSCLHRGSMVAIDDNFVSPDGKHVGKGYLAMRWFEHLDIPCLYSGYQFLWQL